MGPGWECTSLLSSDVLLKRVWLLQQATLYLCMISLLRVEWHRAGLVVILNKRFD